ncbi:hypothetical protein ACFLRP_04940 [Bacteroidota bacterium]
MTLKGAIQLETSETAITRATDECCPQCDEIMIFKHDRNTGYSRLCRRCGYIKYLCRRFLRWNRRHERWE